MKSIGQEQLQAENRRFHKSALRNMLLAQPVNAVLRRVFRPLVPLCPSLSRLPVNLPEVSLTINEQVAVRLVSPDRCEIAKECFWFGGRRRLPADQRALDLLCRLASHAELFLDIGTYTGAYSVAAAVSQPALEVIAFDILPDNLAIARENARLNGVCNDIEFRLTGLGEETGEVTMPRDYRGSVLPSSLSLGSRFEGGRCVPVATLDSQLRDKAGRRAVIKIDVEGFEAQVIAGGAGFIESSRPDIICELLPGSESVAGQIALLLPSGYCYYRITDRGLERAEQLRPCPGARDWLLVAGDGPGNGLAEQECRR